MKQITVNPQRLIGSDQKTPSAPHATSSAPQQKPVKKELIRAVDRLLRFYPALDVGDPEMFIAGIAAIFAQYPPELIEVAIDPGTGIPAQLRNLNLADINRICAKLYEPIEDRIERERAARSHMCALPAPSEPVTEECRARVAAMLADAKARLGPPLIKGARPRKERDGKHAARIAADLEARRARNTVEQSGE